MQRQTLTPHEKVLDRLQDLRKVRGRPISSQLMNPTPLADGSRVGLQVSLRQMNQTRFYVVRRRERPVQVGLLIGGLPPLLGREQYAQLIHQHLTTKSECVSSSLAPGVTGLTSWNLCRSPGHHQQHLHQSR